MDGEDKVVMAIVLTVGLVLITLILTVGGVVVLNHREAVKAGLVQRSEGGTTVWIKP